MGEYAVANTPPSCSLYFKYNRAMRFHSDSPFHPLNGSLLHLIAAVACLLFVFITGATSLQSDPIFNDEYNSLNRVLGPPFKETRNLPKTIELITQLSPEHAPSYFVLLHLWTKLTGTDLMTIRLLSLYFGLLALAFAYQLALVTQDHNTALLAIFLATFMAFFIYYTRLARMYSLLPMVSAWLAWSYWRVRSPANHVRRWNWLSLFASAATILYVHYFGIMTLMAIGAYHLLIARKDRRWFQISVVVLAAGLLFLPWLPVVATDDLAKMAIDRLSMVESARVIVSIYSNGGFALLLLAAFASLPGFQAFEFSAEVFANCCPPACHVVPNSQRICGNHCRATYEIHASVFCDLVLRICGGAGCDSVLEASANSYSNSLGVFILFIFWVSRFLRL